MNVIGTRPDGWWHDRHGAVRALVTRLGRLHDATGQDVTVVFDGRPPRGLAEGDHGGVTVRYAGRGGPDAADDRIIELLDGEDDPGAWTVVTSDRALRARSAALGATVAGAGSLLARLDGLDR